MPRPPKASALVVTAFMLAVAVPARAANPVTISVTVTIQNLSVSATGPIAFGTVVAGSPGEGHGSTFTVRLAQVYPAREPTDTAHDARAGRTCRAFRE